jgi:MraZ protein
MANNTPEYRASYTDSFAHSFDAKGRITVPAEWRDERFENRLFILPSSDKCLRVYPASWFGRLQERVADMKSTDSSREWIGKLASTAQNAAFDQQGRIMVKESFRSSVGLKKDAMLVGRLDHFEIWNKATWDGRDSAPVTVEDALRAMGL